MFAIEKEFHFCAAHRIPELGERHKCAQVHGHSYRVVLRIEGDALKGPGFLVEFCELDAFEALLKTHFDHKFLNDLPEFQTIAPTTENLAQILFGEAKRMFAQTVELRVQETQKTWVIFRG